MSQQQEVRHAAAQAFMESLEQLQHSLEPAETFPPSGPTSNPSTPEPPPAISTRTSSGPSRVATAAPSVAAPEAEPFDLDSFEAAIADIEQYIQAQKGDSEA
jgi:hypothetical protein